MRQFWFVISFVYLAIAQSEIDFPTTDLRIDNITPLQNKTKTWGTIFPGTKWCGQGNKAKHSEDFGKYRLTDMCCKNHDRCPDKIKGGMSKYGLENTGSTTLLSCECDEQFYDCLKRVHTVTSRTVGILYFDILKRKCFTNDINDGYNDYHNDNNIINIENNGSLYKWKHTRRFSNNRLIKLISKFI